MPNRAWNYLVATLTIADSYAFEFKKVTLGDGTQKGLIMYSIS